MDIRIDTDAELEEAADDGLKFVEDRLWKNVARFGSTCPWVAI